MKKLKRVFLFILCFISIFCILLVNVFAARESPYFDSLLDMERNRFYSPYSNLQSLVLPISSVGGDRFYTFNSPYAISAINPLDGFDTDASATYEFAIGSYVKPNSQRDDYYVITMLDYDFCDIGPYCEYSVALTDPFTWGNFETPQFTLHYGESVLPLAPLDIGISSSQPFWPSYSFEVMNFNPNPSAPDYVYLKVSVYAALVSFDYSYFDNPPSYIFSTPPHIRGFNFSTVIRMTYNPDWDMYLFESSLHDLIGDSLSEYMRDLTSRDTRSEYAIFKNIDVTFDISYDSEFLNRSSDSNLIFNNVYLTDYFFDRLDHPLIHYPPDPVSAFEYFTETYPVYELPESFDDLDFTDFLSSVMSIFSIPLIGEFTLAQLLFGVAGIGLLMWFLKMFAGG